MKKIKVTTYPGEDIVPVAKPDEIIAMHSRRRNEPDDVFWRCHGVNRRGTGSGAIVPGSVLPRDKIKPGEIWAYYEYYSGHGGIVCIVSATRFNPV